MTARYAISGIVKETGLTPAQIKYRLKMLGLEGEKITPSLTLYSSDDVDRIKKWKPIAERG